MVTDLNQLAETLLTEARDATNGVVSRTIVHGDRQRAVLMGMLAGHSLGEHNAPPAATLQVLSGRATLHADGQQTRLEAGQLVEIPPVRHDLAAEEDTVAILTVAIDPPEARRQD
jgi:quercetin dioxygenase-like cupin family protein